MSVIATLFPTHTGQHLFSMFVIMFHPFVLMFCSFAFNISQWEWEERESENCMDFVATYPKSLGKIKLKSCLVRMQWLDRKSFSIVLLFVCVFFFPPDCENKKQIKKKKNTKPTPQNTYFSFKLLFSFGGYCCKYSLRPRKVPFTPSFV